MLGAPLEQIKRGLCIDAVDRHQDALGLFDDSAVFDDLGRRFSDRFGLALRRPSFNLVHGYLREPSGVDGSANQSNPNDAATESESWSESAALAQLCTGPSRPGNGGTPHKNTRPNLSRVNRQLPGEAERNGTLELLLQPVGVVQIEERGVHR